MTTFNTYQYLLLILCTIVAISESTDYCRKKICPGNQKHIACRNDGKFCSACPANAAMLPMNEPIIQFIVDEHNAARRGICDGSFDGLQHASRMIEMAWDEELSKLAELTCKTCEYAHDSCRNTNMFNNVGQNIAIYKSKSKASIDTKKVLGGIIKSWLKQAGNCDMKLIESFRSNAGRGDFTQMIQASCAKVGCALSHFIIDGEKNILCVCNYSDACVENKPVYHVGPACSECQAGCSVKTRGLCKNSEYKYMLKLKLLGIIKLNIG